MSETTAMTLRLPTELAEDLALIAQCDGDLLLHHRGRDGHLLRRVRALRRPAETLGQQAQLTFLGAALPGRAHNRSADVSERL